MPFPDTAHDGDMITKWYLMKIRVSSLCFSCVVPWPFLKGDSPNKAHLHPHMAPPFGFLYHRCAGLPRLETVLISLRVCLFTQYVLLYFLRVHVRLLHFKVEEPLHLMRAPFQLMCHLECSRVCLSFNLSMHLCNALSPLKNEMSASR